MSWNIDYDVGAHLRVKKEIVKRKIIEQGHSRTFCIPPKYLQFLIKNKFVVGDHLYIKFGRIDGNPVMLVFFEEDDIK